MLWWCIQHSSLSLITWSDLGWNFCWLGLGDLKSSNSQTQADTCSRGSAAGRVSAGQDTETGQARPG